MAVFLLLSLIFCTISLACSPLKKTSYNEYSSTSDSEASGLLKGSINIYVNNDTITKAEVRIIGVEAERNPLVIYVPFSISQGSLRYDSETHLVALKQYNDYSLISVYLLGKTKGYVFIEFSNQNGEIQNSVSFSSLLKNGEKHYTLKVKKTSSDFQRNQSENPNLFFIDDYYINISSAYRYEQIYDGHKLLAEGVQNSNQLLMLEGNTYSFNYMSQAAFIEDKEPSFVSELIQYLGYGLFASMPLTIISLIKDKDSPEKVPKREKIASIVITCLYVVALILGLISDVGWVRLTILSISYFIPLAIYIYVRKQILFGTKSKDQKLCNEDPLVD